MSKTGSSAGVAYLEMGPLSGTTSLSLARARFDGAAANDYAGASVAGAGDVDADGYADMLVGATGEDSGGSSAGAAYLLYAARW